MKKTDLREVLNLVKEKLHRDPAGACGLFWADVPETVPTSWYAVGEEDVTTHYAVGEEDSSSNNQR